MEEQLELLFKLFYQLILFLLNPIILIPIIIYICVYCYRVKKYKEETYYKITNVSYYSATHDTGRYGEYLIYKKLKEFEQQGAKFLFNIYVPKKDEETTEIDVLMISHKGLFVFESKNYSGWIFGSDNKRYWYQILPSGRRKSRKEKFYNPIFQNNTHIKYLKSLIGENFPFYSIITFSERCTLKDINLHKSNVSVINRYQVFSTVASIYNNTEDLLTDMQVEEIYNTLYPHSQVDENIKQKHIDVINNSLNENNNAEICVAASENEVINKGEVNEINNNIVENVELSINNESSIDIVYGELTNIEPKEDESLVCPSCGAKLVLRKARRGDHVGEEFYGCSNYPKCKYTKKISG